MKIAIAGATGFIGTYLIDELLRNTLFEIKALSRNALESHQPRLQFMQADLYSLLDCERALQDCDFAIYLVHSMLPSSRLAQGNFSDFDFILADNFIKAAKKKGVKKVVYVSGIIPPHEKLSTHLASRLEVEKTLDQNSVHLLCLRCGLVVGKCGSSFQIVERLVERLPLLAMPGWTRNKLQIIYVKDLVSIIIKGIESSVTGSFDVGTPEIIDYQYVIKEVSKIKKCKNIFINIPFMSPAFSKLWVRLVTGLSGRLIFPLIDSLVHNMIVDSARQLPKSIVDQYTSVNDTLRKSLLEDSFPKFSIKRVSKADFKSVSLVQSVQRLPCPAGWSSKDVALAYMSWLPEFLFPFFKIEKKQDVLEFRILGFKQPFFILVYARDRTFAGRDLFYIQGGLLTKKHKSARFEFRRGPQEDFIIAAIHNYRPSLPWPIYRLTQAKLHSFVMWSFGRWLQQQSNSGTIQND